MIDTALVLAELAALDRPALAKRWESAFEVPAPRGCQAMLLRQALAWHVQMQALRKSAGARKTRKAAQSITQAASPAAGTLSIGPLSPGTRLLREWQGRTFHVTVVQGGFEYDGKVWRSLSAIARAITGTPWSGPLFFGLKS